MTSYFGAQAQRVLDALPAGLDAIVFDDSAIKQAAREAVRRRERAEHFYGLALIDDLRVRACYGAAHAINTALADPAQRAQAFHALPRGTLGMNGEPVANQWDPGKAVDYLTAVNYVLAMSDELLVRSFAEYQRFARLRHFNGRAFRRIRIASTVPAFERRPSERQSVAVWTGRRAATDATLALIGLEGFNGEVIYVGDANVMNVRAHRIARSDAALADVLGAAACVVCVDPADPADAAEFARCGVAVVAPLTCAAYEFHDAIVAWDAADATALPSAVAAALARAAAA
jgi:hypothetical protein